MLIGAQTARSLDQIGGIDLREALRITGGLSNPSKMPGYAWGVPAHACITGNKLREVPGSVCSKCNVYDRGRFVFPTVKTAYQRRLDGIWDPLWTEAMCLILNNSVAIGCPYFRWFDSGDLQSHEMLKNILSVVIATPTIHHWLQTKEKKLVREAQRQHYIPNNLTIRVSAPMIDGDTNIGFSHVSRVLGKQHKADWPRLVGTNHSLSYHCPAPLQGNQCGNCRACWDRSIKVVNFLEK